MTPRPVREIDHPYADIYVDTEAGIRGRFDATARYCPARIIDSRHEDGEYRIVPPILEVRLASIEPSGLFRLPAES